MINFTRIICMCGLSLTMTAAYAGLKTPEQGKFDLGKFIYKSSNKHNVFDTQRAKNVNALDARVRKLAATNRGLAPEIEVAPSISLSSMDQFGDMDVAGGGTWFYTVKYDNEYIQHNEYWTEKLIKGYEIKIYDEAFKLRGTIKDKLRLAEDESRAVLADITPLVTRHFFDNDDSYEIMFGLGLNTNTPGNNRCRTLVYKLENGTKDAEGLDLPVYTFDNIVSDVLDATPQGGKENIYLTFADEEYPDVDIYEVDPDTFDMWNEWSMKIYVNFNVYTNVDSNGKMQHVMSKKVRLLELPGDQESTPMLMSMTHDGTPYLVYSRYALPFYNDYNISDYDTDLTMRNGNKLDIEIFRLDGTKANLVQTTSIDAPLTDDAIATYYSIGDLRYRGDVLFGDNGKADFLVTRSSIRNAADETGVKNYSAYKADGTLKAVLLDGGDGGVALSDVPGFEPQYMFIKLVGSTYEYHFVDLLSCKEVLAMDYKLAVEDGDPDPMSSNMERVPYGDSYAYVNELVYPAEDDDTVYMRFAWFDNKGKYINQHWLNMGGGVNYARGYLDASVLKPGVYSTAEEVGYMVLIKRAAASGVTEELLVGLPVSDENPSGKELLKLTPGDKGALKTIAPMVVNGEQKLMVSYDGGSPEAPYAVDFYDLPLDKDHNGVNDIVVDEDKADSITFNGSTVTYNGSFIVVDAQGRTVARANGSLDVASLANGLYIVAADNGASRKLIVK